MEKLEEELEIERAYIQQVARKHIFRAGTPGELDDEVAESESGSSRSSEEAESTT